MTTPKRGRPPRADSDPGPVARQFKAMRDRLGVSQAAVAEILGMTPGMVSQIETGHRVPTVAWRLQAALLVGWGRFDLLTTSEIEKLQARPRKVGRVR